MVKIDLITGFLGSGKTTFIKQYARYLLDQGLNIGILENDYGAVNVDMMLLQELRGDNCELEMVAGACDSDCHKRRFKTKLISMGMCGYDRVLVEPSGIFDVDEFFDTLYEEPLCRWYEIGNVIAIVDAGLDSSLSRESDYLLSSQVANAGAILLSHCQEVSDNEIKSTILHINHAMEQVHCSRIFQSEIIQKDWSTLAEDDWKMISCCGYRSEDFEKYSLDDMEVFSSVYFMNVHLKEYELLQIVKQLLSDNSCGNIFRIKGFYLSDNGSYMELNATKKCIHNNPIPEGQDIIIIIGEHLSEDRIRSYFPG